MNVLRLIGVSVLCGLAAAAHAQTPSEPTTFPIFIPQKVGTAPGNRLCLSRDKLNELQKYPPGKTVVITVQATGEQYFWENTEDFSRRYAWRDNDPDVPCPKDHFELQTGYWQKS